MHRKVYSVVRIQIKPFKKNILKKLITWAGEIAQQIRALAALSRDWSLSPSTHMGAYNCLLTPVSRAPMLSSGLCARKLCADKHTGKTTTHIK